MPYSQRISFPVVLVATFSNNAFSLEYRADLGILIGRWLQALPPPELQGTYEAMLAAAKAYGNRRCWLLDLRPPPPGGPRPQRMVPRPVSPADSLSTGRAAVHGLSGGPAPARGRREPRNGAAPAPRRYP